MGIFNIDNKFFRALNKLVDMVILSFCWIISCIPVFTIGAASTALYDTSRRVIHHDEGYVWRGYWHAFKVNFKQATKAWLGGGYNTYRAFGRYLYYMVRS